MSARQVLVLLAALAAMPAIGAAPAAPVNAANGYSAAALYNLGNAYARAGEPGLAALNYERARLLAPRDADITANLQQLRVAHGLAPEERSGFERIGTAFAAPRVFWVGVAGLALAGAAALARRRLQRLRRTLSALAIVGMLAVAAAAANALALWPTLHRGIVIVKNAPVRVAPLAIGEPLFTLSEAQSVAIRDERAGFYLVKTPQGRIGWTPNTAVARIVPRDAKPP